MATKTTNEPMKKVGDALEWASGAGGTMLTKRGKVLAIVPVGASFWAQLKSLGIAVPPSHIKASSDKAQQARYLVAVPRGGNGDVVDYYGPHVRVIDNALRRTAATKAPKGRRSR